MNVFIANNPTKITEFNNYTTKYANIHKKHKHVCIDFEFNNGKIALMQIMFDTNIIWLVDPTTIDMELFVNNILTNKHIYKVLHGADSLDIPYIYKHMLHNDKTKIIQFTNKLFDTRFLCEYYKISQNDTNPRCSLYTAYMYFKVIDEKKLIELENINTVPIYKIHWNINKLSDKQIKYAIYDVWYLKDLLDSIFKHILTNTPEQTNNYKIIIRLIRLTYLIRNNVINLNKYKEQLHKHNNNKKLLDLYNNILDDFIFKVPYIRKTVEPIYKGKIYSKHVQIQIPQLPKQISKYILY